MQTPAGSAFILLTYYLFALKQEFHFFSKAFPYKDKMLERGNYYHIYNRGVNASEVFRTTNDFKHFLNRYNYYLSLSVETYAYCILNNHFHFLIRVNSEEEQEQILSMISDSNFDDDSYYLTPNPDKKVFEASTLFSHYFNSYSKYFNQKYDRSGPVWDGRFKRRLVESEEYLAHLICYIHRNPIHHGISSNYTNYSFSSYSKILNHTNSLLASDEVLDLFGGEENYKAAHQEIKPHFDLTNYFEKDA